jgi:hypothetical protein
MAQTKRKRRTKHRGNAAGIVEHRGRTSRPPSPEERKALRKEEARAARGSRATRPPSWRAAANRSLITTLLFVVVIVFILKQPVQQAIGLGGLMLLLYIPFGYYFDAFLYKRHQARKSAGGR